MESASYASTTYWTIGVNVTFWIAFLVLLKTGKASGMLKVIFGLLSIGWIAFIHYIGVNQAVIPASIPNWAYYTLTLSLAALVLAVMYFSPIKKVFNNVSQVNMQIVQGLRVFVASGFLMEGVLGVVPGWFSIMDGFFHVTSGFLALVAAIAILKSAKTKNSLLWLANIVGLLDIVVIVTSISFVVWQYLGPFHNMNYVVFYTGVILLWLHLISILKLLNSKSDR